MGAPRWLDEREAHLWRAWLRVAHELPRVLEDEINRDSGLSAADYAVLIPLSESAEGALRPRDIGREIWWDRSRLSHQLTRMEKRGLVAREECAEDGRGALVRMTPAGRAAIESAAPDHVASTRRYFFDQLSGRDIEVLTRVFDRVLANLDQAGHADDANSEAPPSKFVDFGMAEAMAQAMTDMAAAKNAGIDNALPRTPENSTPTSFRQWCEEVLKPAVTDHAATATS